MRFTCVLFLSFLFSRVLAASTATTTTSSSGLSQDARLRVLLSPGASITHNASVAPRWSEFGAPNPGTVVNVATEHDVLVTVCLTQGRLHHLIR